MSDKALETLAAGMRAGTEEMYPELQTGPMIGWFGNRWQRIGNRLGDKWEPIDEKDVPTDLVKARDEHVRQQARNGAPCPVCGLIMCGDDHEVQA